MLTPKGIYVYVGGSRLTLSLLETMILGRLTSASGSKKTKFFVAKLNNEDLVFLKALLEEGKVKPVIDRRYLLSEVPQALRHFKEGHAKGKVVITVA